MAIQTTNATKQAIRRAQSIAEKYEQSEVTVAHFLLGMLDAQGLGAQFLSSLNVPLKELRLYLRGVIEDDGSKKGLFDAIPFMRKKGSAKVSKEFATLMQQAVEYAGTMGDSYVSSEVIIVSLLHDTENPLQQHLVSYVSPQQAEAKLQSIRGGSSITGLHEREYQFLNEFGRNITTEARKGEMDPIIGRDVVIRESIQILSQKTKNNPVLVGEPGVGKSAIVEGLAQRIVKGDVPSNLIGCQLVSIDMQSLTAGARYKGDFEKRLKGVLADAKSSNGKIILFIDEIHTIVGAGGQGSGDASNAIKPALARGEVAIIGATTTDEYREYIEGDGALDRRFQRVSVPEPSVQDAVSILRGLKEGFEKHHHVLIHDNALVAAVELSDRYIGDRYLPDKAIDIVDQASAEVKVQMNSTPEPIDKANRRILQLEVELQALEGEVDQRSKQQAFAVQENLEKAKQQYNRLRKRWLSEKKALGDISAIRDQLVMSRQQLERANEQYDKETIGDLQQQKIPQLEQQLDAMNQKFEQVTKGQSLMQEKVTEEQIATVLSHRTGIPLTKLMSDDKEKLLHLDKELEKRVVGQEEAVSAVSNTVIRSRVGAQNPNRPIGSFLFLGPSGTGKTELAKTLAEFLFDTESAMIRLDMSEYMEKHSVNRLIGAPPGYVGYEEGGQLTEAVRKQPYSVVLFDEVEKAHVEVFDTLLQILDDGRVTDGKGNVVDFTNAIIIMTSNLGSKFMLNDQQAIDGHGYMANTRKQVEQSVHGHFRPEFINRIDEMIIFNPLGVDVSKPIVDKMLYSFCERMFDNRYSLFYTERLIEWIAKQAYDPRFGARPFDRYIQNNVEVPFSKAVLSGQVNEGDEVQMDVNASNQLYFSVTGKMQGYA